MAADFTCWDCRWNDLGFPCRIAGHPNLSVIASTYVASLPLEHDPDQPTDIHWSSKCIDAAVRQAPEVAWPLLLECVRLLRTRWQATLLAAGPVEDLVVKHGEAFIERIEDEARRTPRFRFVLTGVWVHGSPVRQRIERLKASRPQIDAGDALPPE